MKLVACVISRDWMDYARRKATGRPFNKDTILEGGAGQYAGVIGELAFGRFLRNQRINFDYVADQQPGFDFLVNGLKIDVKTKQCTSKPRPNYTAHVTQSQRNHNADIYVFARTTDREVWLCGWLTKEEFWNTPNASDVKQGQMADGLTQSADARRIQIQFLRPVSELTDLLRSGAQPGSEARQ